MGRYQFGEIVEAVINDKAGRVKPRPCVIISGDDSNDRGESLQVIAITKSIEKPRPSYHILVHDSCDRDPVTGLYVPCVAKCNWFREFPQEKVIGRFGHLPDDLLELVVDQFDLLFSDPTFPDGKWI